MSQFIEVEITISQLVHDLRAGLTWFASEDKGQGSIQAKHEMEDEDIIAIMGHPAFNQPIRTFKIIDDYTKKPAAQPVAVVEEPETVCPEPEPQSEASYLAAPEPEVQPMRPADEETDLFGNLAEFRDADLVSEESESEDGALDFMSL